MTRDRLLNHFPKMGNLQTSDEFGYKPHNYLYAISSHSENQRLVIYALLRIAQEELECGHCARTEETVKEVARDVLRMLREEDERLKTGGIGSSKKSDRCLPAGSIHGFGPDGRNSHRVM